MAPLYRLADRRYATLADLKAGALSRAEVIAANEWLDARDEAEAEANRKK